MLRCYLPERFQTDSNHQPRSNNQSRKHGGVNQELNKILQGGKSRDALQQNGEAVPWISCTTMVNYICRSTMDVHSMVIQGTVHAAGAGELALRLNSNLYSNPSHIQAQVRWKLDGPGKAPRPGSKKPNRTDRRSPGIFSSGKRRWHCCGTRCCENHE